MGKSIIITGGHFTPGLAIIPELKKTGWDVFWLGENKAMGGSWVQTLEALSLPGLGIPFYPIRAAKLARGSHLTSVLNLWKLPVGFIQSLWLLAKLKPQVLLSFGSYVSIPPAIACWLAGIPIVIHEQTSASGLANRIVAKLADKVFISYPSSMPSFPEGKTRIIGNLVRSDIFSLAKKRTKRGKNKIPVLYITGGSRGSQVINSAVFEILHKLTANHKVFHQTGALDYTKAEKVRSRLAKAQQGNYEIAETYRPEEVEGLFLEADFVLSRAGANTVSEIAALGIPAILIPLPNTESDEQAKNAEMLENAGIAKILPQKILSGKTLLATIHEVQKNLGSMQKKAKVAQKLVPEGAAKRLADEIEKLL